MKTPIQQLIRLWKEQQKEAPTEIKGMYRLFIEDAEEMLEKEKEVMCEIYDDSIARFDRNYLGGDGERYYNEIFEPIER